MISEQQWEDALQWLVDNAEPAAIARANFSQLDRFTKVLRAQLMSESNERSLGAREVYAMAHPKMEVHLTGLADAEKEDQWFRWKKDTSMTINSAYQTQSANTRGLR